MRRLQCALLAAVAAIGFASIASAADMPVKARPMVVAPYNWTGFYIGATAGYGWGRYTLGDATGDGPGVNPGIGVQAITLALAVMGWSLAL